MGGGGGRILRAAMMSSGRVPFAQGTAPSATASPGIKPGRTPRVVSIPSSPAHGSVRVSTGSGRWESLVLEEDYGPEFDGEGSWFDVGERYVFGPAPTEEEVEEAILAIGQVYAPMNLSQVSEAESSYTLNREDVHKIGNHSSSAITDMDYRRTPLQISNSNTEKTLKVVDSFRSLQTNPSIKRMVLSLSSDKAVWDAIRNNESVKELRESFCAGESNNDTRSDQNLDVSTRILRCFLEKMKEKLMEFISNIQKIVSELFHNTNAEEKMDAFEEAVRSSFMLSVVVIMVVILFRDQRALNSQVARRLIK